MTRSLRILGWLLTLALGLGAAGQVRAQDFTKLFNGTDLTGWKFKLKDDAADPLKTFVVKGGIIEVSGFPYGYLYTDKSFSNFVVKYSWRYPKDQPEKTTMNSGLLIHITGAPKVWPHCIEPQGRYKDHGKLFFMGFDKGVKNPSNFDEEAHKKALKAADEWQTTETIAKADGSIEVRLNGTLVSTGKSSLTSGAIGFQSEGARIDFKDIMIKELK
jgi:hypothetical protein